MSIIPVTVVDAVHDVVGDPDELQMNLVLGSEADTCAVLVSSAFGDSEGLSFEIKAVNPDAPATWGTGSFDQVTPLVLADGTVIGVQKLTLLRFQGGAPVFSEEATTASVTFDYAEPGPGGWVEGSFDATFPSGGPVTGSFVAPYCDW